MSKQNEKKGRRFGRAFKEEAVRLLQTGGCTQRQIAGDLGISVSALCRWVAAPEPVLSIFGPDFVAASAALRILALGQLVNLATGSVGTILIMTGHQRISLLNSVAGAVMVVILGLILIPRYGATGAAAAASITMAIRNISATYLVWRFVGVNVVTGQVRRQKTHLGPSSQ